jgi:hypothetical protein
MGKPGHLECYFDCGTTFSSLEALALHIELDHREGNDISPFVIRESPPRSTLNYPPPAPLKPPSPVPRRSEGGSRSRSKFMSYFFLMAFVSAAE